MDIRAFRVSPDGKYLDVWVEISSSQSEQAFNITHIAISSHRNFKYVETLSGFNPDDFEFHFTPSNTKKVLTRIDLDRYTSITRAGLYYMYIFTDKPANNSLQEECCCNCKAIEIAVAVDLMPLYNIAIRYFEKAFCEPCDDDAIRKDIIDIYLKKTMLLQAINLEDFTSANTIWDDLLKDDVLRGDCMNSMYGNNRRYLPRYTGAYRRCMGC